MNKPGLALVAVAALMGTPALAADMPPAAIAAPVYSWTGFYVGGNAGGSWGNFDPSTSAPFNPAGTGLIAPDAALLSAAGATQSIKPGGFTGGLEAGYNWQASNIVLGLEGDIEAFQLRGSSSVPGTFPGPISFTVSSSASTTWLATARGRVGFATNNWLFYGTGGAAFTTLKGNFAFSDGIGDMEAASLSSTKTGYTVGGGIEAGLWSRWTAKIEYLYVDFGTVSTSANLNPPNNGQVVNNSINLKANIVRAGLNYRF